MKDFGELTKMLISNGLKDVSSRGRASQSSSSRWSNPNDAQRATTDNTFDFAFHTGEDSNAWWKLELPRAQYISYIIVENRRDEKYQHKANDISVFCTDASGERLVYRGNSTFGALPRQLPLIIALDRKMSISAVRIAKNIPGALHLSRVRLMCDDELIEDAVIETIFGCYLESSAQRLLITFSYEKGTLFAFKEVVHQLQATRIVDIGANIGVYSIYAGQEAAVTQIDAFEPAPAAYALLKKNIDVQEFRGKLTAHPLALSSADGEVQFEMFGDMAGNNHILENGVARGKVIPVRTAKLDEVLTYSGHTVCMKIDVEGHELAVFEGAADFLCRNQCFVQVECLDGEAFNAIDARMNSMGYKYLCSLVDDHFFVHDTLEQHRNNMLKIIFRNVSSELLSLRQSRSKANLDVLLIK
ncbi:MAG: FkbM family methyltransferase [Shinella sp.]|nr:FkbM family methyltransferase [Shinella sp.]